MKQKPNSRPEQIRSLSVEQWHEMGQAGQMIPVTICLEGDSMRPLIRRGKDRVTIMPLSRPLKKGDIVLFRGGPNRYVVHRVRCMKDDRVQTMGDNCYRPDPWTPVENIIGIVVKMERSGCILRLDAPAARFWGRVWMQTHPIRMIYRRFRSMAGRCYRKMFRRLK